MTLKELEYILELNGVMREDIETLLDFSKKNGILVDRLDNELEKLGYERVIENELNSSYDDEDDEDFGYVQKFSSKKKQTKGED